MRLVHLQWDCDMMFYKQHLIYENLTSSPFLGYEDMMFYKQHLIYENLTSSPFLGYELIVY